MLFYFLLQVYDQKANVAKEEYQKAMQEYKASGGGDDKEKKSNDTKEKKSKSKSSTVSTLKTGSGTNYVSKEFIEDDDSSSSDDDKSKKVCYFILTSYFSVWIVFFATLIYKMIRSSRKWIFGMDGKRSLVENRSLSTLAVLSAISRTNSVVPICAKLEKSANI